MQPSICCVLLLTSMLLWHSCNAELLKSCNFDAIYQLGDCRTQATEYVKTIRRASRLPFRSHFLDNGSAFEWEVVYRFWKYVMCFLLLLLLHKHLVIPFGQSRQREPHGREYIGKWVGKWIGKWVGKWIGKWAKEGSVIIIRLNVWISHVLSHILIYTLDSHIATMFRITT